MPEPLLLLLLQVGPSPEWSSALRFTLVSAVFVVLVSVITFYVLRANKPKTDSGVKESLAAEFEKSREALLLAAQAKKAAKAGDDAARREAEVEAKERELLRENVDAQRVIGQVDPLSGLEMMPDMELIIDPYTGQGYLLPSFLNDWPADQDRPRFVYRYPQGTVVKTTDLVRSL